jgi:HAD superfamily hydrolase (TIGR01509 family)
MNKLIIFDCDGTLVDSEVIASKVYPAYWATHGVIMTENEFKETFIGTGRNAAVVVEHFSKMPAHAASEGDLLYNEALSKNLRAVKGISTLLSSLNSDMCVASNSSLNHVKNALIKTKLNTYFGKKVFSSEEVENPKPSPDIFYYAALKCGHSIDDCIVVEDSVSGVKAAQNAGIKVIGFSGARHFMPSLEERLKEMNPDWFCGSAHELREILNSFQRS